jgi:threonine dehydratase
MHYSLQKGKVLEVPLTVSLADGIAVKKVGKNTFPIVQQLVDEVVLVEEEDIALAIVALLERSKLMVEGAGAVPLAALLSGAVKKFSGKTVCVLSGGNIDVKTISVVVERGLLAAGRYLKLRIELDDVPGALARLATEIAHAKANISIITHDRRSKSLPIGKTEVLIELETRGYEHIADVVKHLEGVSYLIETVK